MNFRLAFVSLLVLACLSARAELVDKIQLGAPESESTHHLVASDGGTSKGGLDQPERTLLPLKPATWKGGKLSFKMKVNPDVQNYVTVKFWGNDVTRNRLVTYVEGKQLGWFHLGDVECLDSGNDDGTPGFNDRFFYRTSPLPFALTTGKSEVSLEIRSMGPIWGYGGTWEAYQKTMVEPSRGIYAVYTHTDGCFTPPADEPQGTAPNKGVRTTPGEEVLEQVKERENGEIDSELKSKGPLGELQMQFLANAYWVKWSHGYQNAAVVKTVAEGLDDLYSKWKAKPDLLTNDPRVYNAGWLRFGPAGEAVFLLAEPLKGYLDQPAPGGTETRRKQWAEMLKASRDDALANRRLYTNQTMIVDLNAYRANRGLESIDPANSLPEERMLDYLKQSIGLKPWLGSDTPTGSLMPMGDNYWQLTKKGLTRELGYVGYYGEVIDWVSRIYEATRSLTATGFGPGDESIRQQLVKIVKARSVFRYPSVDGDGHPAMRIETIVGWRDEGHYPGNIGYAERPSWDGTALSVVRLAADPEVTGYAQQMLNDGQFFDCTARSLKGAGFRVVAGLLGLPDDYEYLKNQKPTGATLPMSPGHGDLVWADEEDGVVAVKHKDDVLYVSLYWRARNAINFLARVHFTQPNLDRIAEVAEQEQFDAMGDFYTRPDWVNMAFGNGGIRYPDDLHCAVAGEKLPIAKIPAGIAFKPGDENPFAGRANFYKLRYGHYLIGMNAGKTDVKLDVPKDEKSAQDLTTQKPVEPGSTVVVSPGSTAVIYLE